MMLLFLVYPFPGAIRNRVSWSLHISPLCQTSFLIYLPSSNVKRLCREAGLPGADCVSQLMISSYSAILWSSGAWIVFSAHSPLQ